MNGVHLTMVSSNAYIQAPGLMKKAGEWISRYGNKLFIITGEKSWASVSPALPDSLAAASLAYGVHRYRGECSQTEIDRLSDLVPDDTDLIVGVGGGKVLDITKAVCFETKRPFVAIPTIAATCAAVTNLAIKYTDDGVYEGFDTYLTNTLLALVDSAVIAKAPLNYLAAGIGDTVAKWYESAASSSGKNHNLATVAGLQMAKLCYDTLTRYGAQAYNEAKQGVAGDALQHVIDAIILASGMVGGLGEDDCRSAAAHAVHNGLTVLPESHHALHGSKVAYGILVQLIMEGRPREEVDELRRFYRSVDLPCSLSELGIERPLSEAERREIARVALLPVSTMGMMPFPVTESMVVTAMKQTDREYAERFS
ncbi:MAG: dhaD [Paenibacillaceae bacterium]|jgi:glycerol dehydrogenase|nr:dhaD [Paenibacillaceae bacterium]